MSNNNNNPKTDGELNILNCERKIWLVKVPKYIAKKWDKAPKNMNVGKLRITNVNGQKQQLSMSLSEEVLSLKEAGEENIPEEYKLSKTTVTRQNLAVFSQITPTESDDKLPKSGKLCIEGRITQKIECTPYIVGTFYMKLKEEAIKKATAPRRPVKQIAIVQNFKPVSEHQHNIEYQKRKKTEGKKIREEKDTVLEILFAAFEKHQYYNIKDLVEITRQPLPYLKMILRDVCNYNMTHPHRNTWELKPEYRHYESNKKEDDDGTK